MIYDGMRHCHYVLRNVYEAYSERQGEKRTLCVEKTFCGLVCIIWSRRIITLVTNEKQTWKSGNLIRMWHGREKVGQARESDTGKKKWHRQDIASNCCWINIEHCERFIMNNKWTDLITFGLDLQRAVSIWWWLNYNCHSLRGHPLFVPWGSLWPWRFQLLAQMNILLQIQASRHWNVQGLSLVWI